MNSLEQYIGDLNPSCWLNADHVNGIGVAQPSIDDNVSTWVDISGNGLIFKQSFFVSPVPCQFKIGSDNIPYIETSGTSGGVLMGDLRTVDNIFNSDFTEILVFKGIQNRYGYSQVARIINTQQYNENTNTSYVFKKYNYANYPAYQACISNVIVGVKQSLQNVGYVVDEYIGDVRGNLSNSGGGGYNNHAGLFSIGGSPNIVTGSPYSDSSYGTIGINKTLVCEFIYINRSLTITEVKQVQTYLKLKYNI